MHTQASHGLSLSGDASLKILVEAFGLYHGEGHFSVQQRVMRQVDPLFAALAQNLLTW